MTDPISPQTSPPTQPPTQPPSAPGPGLTPTWRWPERSRPGVDLSPSASQPITSGPGGDPSGDLPVETPRSTAIKSSIIALLSAGLAAMASFGFSFTESQAAALMAVATAIITLWTLVRRGRRGG